jgi:hypothetical protein
LIAPPARVVGNVVRTSFVVIILCFLCLLFVKIEPPSRPRLCKAGNKREGLPMPMAVGHQVNLAAPALTRYATNQAGQDKSA